MQILKVCRNRNIADFFLKICHLVFGEIGFQKNRFGIRFKT